MPSLDCPKQSRCPGCPLGAEPYGAGLQRKGQALAEICRDFRDLDAELSPARAASPTTSYRLRAKLVCAGRSLGLYERGTHHVIDIEGCRVLSSTLAQTAAALRQALPLPIYGADLRETSEGVLVTLLTEEPEAQSALEPVARALLAQGAALSVAVSVRPAGNQRVLAGEPRVVVGPLAARHRLSEELPYGYAAHGGFVQAHAGQASYVQRAIAAGLEQRLGGLGERAVLELFAGSGGLSLLLARSGAKVTAVESYAPAIALVERAAREQHLTVLAHTGDASRFVLGDAVGRYDAVIVNPPRRGLEPELRRALAGLAPRALAYVSCNPDTLARDLWHLRLLGLSAERIEPLDMIPWSDAVEALAWLAPAPAPAPRVLFEDEHWLALDKPAYEPLAAESGQVEVERFDQTVSGVSWLAKTEAAAGALRTALASAERELLLLARGNLRKQGTITRREAGASRPGTRYKKQASVGRHSLVSALSHDADEACSLRDFASIGHPVLGDGRFGDARSNLHLEHRHGLDRPFVHVSAMRLRGEAGVELRVRSELAPDLKRVLASARSD